MGHKEYIYFVTLLLWIILISNATYTSEDRSDNTKSLYRATPSVLGSTDISHQYRIHVYDSPPAYGYSNAPHPHSAYLVGGSESYFSGIAPSGGFGESTSNGRAYTNGPVSNVISPRGGFVGIGDVPCSQRNCGSESYYANIAGGGISDGSLGAGNGNRVPYANGPLLNGGLTGIGCSRTDVACLFPNRQNRDGNTVRPETEEIDYSKPPVGTFDPTVTGGGNADVLALLGSPSKRRQHSITSGLLSNSNGYAPPTFGYAPPITSNTGYPPYSGYPTQPHYIDGGGYDSSVLPDGGYPQGGYMHQQPPHLAGYNTLDHTLKSNSEHNENGHHVGYYQAPNAGFGYTGVFDRQQTSISISPLQRHSRQLLQLVLNYIAAPYVLQVIAFDS